MLRLPGRTLGIICIEVDMRRTALFCTAVCTLAIAAGAPSMGAGAYREATVTSRLVDDTGALTALGRIYAEFDGDAAGSITTEPPCAAGG